MLLVASKTSMPAKGVFLSRVISLASLMRKDKKPIQEVKGEIEAILAEYRSKLDDLVRKRAKIVDGVVQAAESAKLSELRNKLSQHGDKS